jgi:hypothetical protein
MWITLGANSKQCEQENFERERERGEGRNKSNGDDQDGDLFPKVWFG